MERATYTIPETARILGVSRSSAYQAVRVGEIPTIKVGRRLLVPKVALERMLVEAGADVHECDSGSDQATRPVTEVVRG